MKLHERMAKDVPDTAISPAQLALELVALPEWKLERHEIVRQWTFPDHYKTIAFVNAVAWVSHREDHHPEMHVGYNTVQVRYWTHSCGGVSEKDLVCAAKLDRL